MSGIEIDPDKLDPKARADFLNVLRAEEQRLEVESVEARQRIDAADTQDILDDIERQGRQKRQAAARTAELANRRINGALTKVHTHLERASDRSLSSQERRAEETVARDAFRRIEEWRDIAETMQRSAKVIEPDIYSPTSPYSYFADLAALADHTNPEHRAAALARLDAYGNDLARDQGKAGLRARRAWRERSRTDIGFQECIRRAAPSSPASATSQTETTRDQQDDRADRQRHRDPQLHRHVPDDPANPRDRRDRQPTDRPAVHPGAARSAGDHPSPIRSALRVGPAARPTGLAGQRPGARRGLSTHTPTTAGISRVHRYTHTHTVQKGGRLTTVLHAIHDPPVKATFLRET